MKKQYVPMCPYCRGRVQPMDDPPHEWYICSKHGELPTKDVEMVDVKELS